MGSAAAGDRDYVVDLKKMAAGGSMAMGGAARSARRSLAKDLKDQEPYSPRLFTKKQLLLLQQQRQCQFLEEHRQHSQHQHFHQQQQQQQQTINLLNSRSRVYPPSSSSSRQILLRNAGEYFDGSSHGSSPMVLPRKIPKKTMIVDEKQLAMKLLRVRNLVSSSSTTSSSSSSENPSLRASIEGGAVDFLPRASLDLPRRSSLLGSNGYGPRIHALARQRSVSSSSSSAENDISSSSMAGGEKIKSSMVVSCSGRSSDAEDSTGGSGSRGIVRRVFGRNGGSGSRMDHLADARRQAPPLAPMLLRSASCSSAMSSASSGLSKMVRLKAADMRINMQEHAFYCANEVLDAMDKLHCKRVAWTLKKEFDKAYGPAWHCIVGTSFGSYVTHSVGGFLYFSIGKVSVLLFQTAVELIEQH